MRIFGNEQAFKKEKKPQLWKVEKILGVHNAELIKHFNLCLKKLPLNKSLHISSRERKNYSQGCKFPSISPNFLSNNELKL